MCDENRIRNETWYTHKRDTGEDTNRYQSEYQKMQVMKIALIRAAVADLLVYGEDLQVSNLCYG